MFLKFISKFQPYFRKKLTLPEEILGLGDHFRNHCFIFLMFFYNKIYQNLSRYFKPSPFFKSNCYKSLSSATLKAYLQVCCQNTTLNDCLLQKVFKITLISFLIDCNLRLCVTTI